MFIVAFENHENMKSKRHKGAKLLRKHKRLPYIKTCYGIYYFLLLFDFKLQNMRTVVNNWMFGKAGVVESDLCEMTDHWQ